MEERVVNEAFIRDLTRYQDRLFAYIFSLLGDVDESRDVLQEVNQCLFLKVGKGLQIDNFAGFARKIAHDKVQDFWRTKNRKRVLFDHDLLESIPSEINEVMDDYDERLSALRTCIEKLPIKKRKMLMQRYTQCLSVKEIGAGCNRTGKAISMMLSRVRLQLLSCIMKQVAREAE